VAKMVNQHVAGDDVSYDKFGAHIFRQLNSKQPVRFQPAQVAEIKVEKDHDRDLVSDQERYACGIYLPKKGAIGAKNNQNQSSLSSVLNMEQVKRDAGIRDYLRTFRPKDNRDFGSQLTFDWDSPRNNKKLI